MSIVRDFEEAYERGYRDGLAANAAPDLLEALARLVTAVKPETLDNRGLTYLQEAHTAIAKAKGEAE